MANSVQPLSCARQCRPAAQLLFPTSLFGSDHPPDDHRFGRNFVNDRHLSSLLATSWPIESSPDDQPRDVATLDVAARPDGSFFGDFRRPTGVGNCSAADNQAANATAGRTSASERPLAPVDIVVIGYHLPMQKRANSVSRISSTPTLPVMRPSARKARRRSSARSSDNSAT